VKTIKKLGGLALKFVSPGTRGVPDRIILLPIPQEHREIVAKYIWFVECKTPGEKPRPDQAAVHRKFRKLGFRVEVIDEMQKW
jgi:hypothetical protein